MRRRIRNAINTAIEVAAELGWDLAIQYVTHSKDIAALQQRVTDLEYALATRGAAVPVDTQGRPMPKARPLSELMAEAERDLKRRGQS
jgi:hypothetical protein